MIGPFSQRDVILILVATVGVLTGGLLYFIFKFYVIPARKRSKKHSKFHHIREDLEEFDPDEVLEDCFFHPNEKSIGSCCICHKFLCKKCWREADDLQFCTEHLKLYLGTEWEVLTEIRTTPETTEESLKLYRFKKDIWDKDEMPSFVVTHYQLDFYQDHIESHIKFYIPKTDWDKISTKFEKKIKQQKDPS